ncbi:peptidoglycan N-acetylmuramoylhydrolase [Burkholderia ubonensis]|nr:peptidoglycan N-acetylmuramoylhydrolase [Burkholderia ubonensis]
MRPARRLDDVNDRRPAHGAVLLALCAIAVPTVAHEVPGPLVWTRVDAALAEDRPASALAAVPADSPRPALRKPHPGERNTHYDTLIDTVARDFDLDAELLHAMIEIESHYDANVRSPKGAVGLMQVMPATGRRFGFVDLTDPYTNLRAGATYLKWLLKIFDNNLELAVAGYNAGEGAVMKAGWQIPPYRETQLYVNSVLTRNRTPGNSSEPRTASSGRHQSASAAPSRQLPVSVLGKLAGILLSSPRSPAR